MISPWRWITHSRVGRTAATNHSFCFRRSRLAYVCETLRWTLSLLACLPMPFSGRYIFGRHSADIRYFVNIRFGENHGNKHIAFGKTLACASTHAKAQTERSRSCLLKFCRQLMRSINHSTLILYVYKNACGVALVSTSALFFFSFLETANLCLFPFRRFHLKVTWK